MAHQLNMKYLLIIFFLNGSQVSYIINGEQACNYSGLSAMNRDKKVIDYKCTPHVFEWEKKVKKEIT